MFRRPPPRDADTLYEAKYTIYALEAVNDRPLWRRPPHTAWVYLRRLIVAAVVLFCLAAWL